MLSARDWFDDGSVFVVDVPLACCALETEAAAQGRGVVDPAGIPEDARVVVTLSGTLTAPALPAGAVPLGLLCIGPVDRFYETPLLIQQQWRQARPVPALFTENNWAPSWNTDTSATTEQPLHS